MIPTNKPSQLGYVMIDDTVTNTGELKSLIEWKNTKRCGYSLMKHQRATTRIAVRNDERAAGYKRGDTQPPSRSNRNHAGCKRSAKHAEERKRREYPITLPPRER